MLREFDKNELDNWRNNGINYLLLERQYPELPVHEDVTEFLVKPCFSLDEVVTYIAQTAAKLALQGKQYPTFLQINSTEAEVAAQGVYTCKFYVRKK